uniref:Uncharacterized protein n=1 Tax=Anguilla anguilla TaxID=7936 RepID=A0A0E9Y2P1_ANGAN
MVFTYIFTLGERYGQCPCASWD